MFAGVGPRTPPQAATGRQHAGGAARSRDARSSEAQAVDPPQGRHCSWGKGPSKGAVGSTHGERARVAEGRDAADFFWRGLLVIRRRTSADSVELHRKAMSAGMFFTMTILWQRPLQAVAFIGLRRAMLRAAAALQLEWPRRVALRLLDHHVGLAVSTAIIGVPSMLLDGPRSWLARSMLDLSEEQVEELYGSREPGTMEVLLWRLRLPVYLVLRALITDFWTSNPDP
ncbi:unnamed protein product [Prorocentrum cordatum]|uniref:Uncharacterized protein n=1 Tax=Prorocentrum cordatum TaxID=2364126 RepID=A0ABN9RJ11_9DINO|nr:unnamed protein product [Polarella glacialis]